MTLTHPILAANEIEIVVGVVFALIWVVGQLVAMMGKKTSKQEDARRRAEIREKVRRGPSPRGDLPPGLDPDRSARQSDEAARRGRFDDDVADEIEGRRAGLDAARADARRRAEVAKRERDDARRRAETKRQANAKREAAEARLAEQARRNEHARRSVERPAGPSPTRPAPVHAAAVVGAATPATSGRSATLAKLAPIADLSTGSAGRSGSTSAARGGKLGLAALLRGGDLRRQIVLNEVLRPPVGLRPPDDRGV